MNSINVQADTSPLDRALAGWLAAGNTCIGQVAILTGENGGYVLCHRDDAAQSAETLQSFLQPEDAEEIARNDDAGTYRPLKTAPNLRHGWRLSLDSLPALRLALDCLYPGRVGAFFLWGKNRLPVTSLRETLGRQTGMYRITQKLTDEQAVGLVSSFCRSDGGCARTILWSIGKEGDTSPKLMLPPEKFDPACDQVVAGSGQPQTVPTHGKCLPMFCQEACNLLVAEARAVIKGKKTE